MSNPDSEENGLELKASNVNGSSGFVTLPVKAADFKQFINSLLGTPQAIVKYYPGGFICNSQLLNDIYHLFDQRISMQQHGSYLAKFYGVLGFDDDSSIEFNNIDQITTFNHLGNEICTNLNIVMQYIILNREGKPEKQTISVTFSAPIKIKKDTDNTNDASSPYFVGIELRIEFTDRTWAYDIVHLFTSFIEPRLKKIPPVAVFSNSVFPEFVRSFWLFAFLIPLFKLAASVRSFSPKNIDPAILADNSLLGIANKMNYSLQRNYQAELGFPNINNFMAYMMSIMVLAIVSIAFRKRIVEFATYKNFGYILLSKSSENNMLRQEARNSKGKFWILNFLLLSLSLGVLGNLATDLLKQFFK